MAIFNGRAFMLGIQHLDAHSRELFFEHGKTQDGRRALVEQIIDDAMVRLLGHDLDGDGGDGERSR